jgi:phage shock protein E
MKLVYTLIVVGILLAVFYILYKYAMDSPYRISSEEARNRIQNHQIDMILDVRTNVERSSLGFYPGSVHIQSSELEERMPREFPNKDIRIVAYCNSGQRARSATEKLRALGYTNAVYIVATYRSLL